MPKTKYSKSQVRDYLLRFAVSNFGIYLKKKQKICKAFFDYQCYQRKLSLWIRDSHEVHAVEPEIVAPYQSEFSFFFDHHLFWK